MKVLVEALQNFPYDYADRKVGDKFECDAEHARVFEVHGKIKTIKQIAEELPEQMPYPTASHTAEEDGDDAVERRRNKKYKRRDMRAEE